MLIKFVLVLGLGGPLFPALRFWLELITTLKLSLEVLVSFQSMPITYCFRLANSEAWG